MPNSRSFLVAAGLLAAIPVPVPAVPPAPHPVTIASGCELSARALLQSAYRTADAQAWESIAACAQDPTCELALARAAADDERRAARELAEAQFTARIAACAVLGEDVYAPAFVPAASAAEIVNPWVALVPGRTLVYAKRSEGAAERVEVATRARTVEIAGVSCREVRTRETLDGTLVEETHEWFAQALDGSVWCFGESVRKYESGFLSGTGGSWRAGVDGARPGMLVPASTGERGSFRRALAIGCVEDVRRVVADQARVSVPAGDFGGALHVEEWDPLEPLELLIEILVPGLGLVAEVDLNTGERLELIEIHDAPR